MKVVALTDKKQKLADLAKAAQGETVLITRGGKPFAFLTGAARYDWEDVEYMSDPAFWRMIEKARREPTVPIDEVRETLGLPAKATPRAPRRRRVRTPR